MSDANRFDRRSLFDAFRRALGSDGPRETSRTRGGFSLSAFYERRERDEAASEAPPFPRFEHRQGLAAVETTAVGVGPAEPAKDPPRGGVA